MFGQRQRKIFKDSLGQQLRCGCLWQLVFYFVCCCSPVWTETSQLSAELTDGIASRHSVVGRGESAHKAPTAILLVPTSPVTEKRSVDRPIRTESTESITDWANRTGAIAQMHGKTQRSHKTLRPHHLPIAACGYYDIFSKKNTNSCWCLLQSYQLQL